MGPIRKIQIEPNWLDAELPALDELRVMGIDVGPPDGDAPCPSQTMYITETAKGLKFAKDRGLIPILLMSDPDEAMKLTALEPDGAIVSLLELPDFVRLLRSRLPNPLPGDP
jgi:hypothetical protein